MERPLVAGSKQGYIGTHIYSRSLSSTIGGQSALNNAIKTYTRYKVLNYRHICWKQLTTMYKSTILDNVY